MILAAEFQDQQEPDRAVQRQLIAEAYRQSPAELISALLKIIDLENLECDQLFVTDRIEDCLDERLANTLLAVAEKSDLNPGCLEGVLQLLMSKGFGQAQRLAESFVSSPPPSDLRSRKKCALALKLLILHGHSKSWPAVLRCLESDMDFGRDVFLGAASEIKTSALAPLTETQMGELYSWMTRAFPPEKDPEESGGFIGHRGTVAHLRDTLTSHLAARGTAQACSVLFELHSQSPQSPILQWHLNQAKQTLLRQTWTPPAPHDFVLLASDSSRRLVRSGDELLRALLECIGTLQHELQGQTPAAIDLWNEKPYEPKDEGRLTDLVKRHLERDLRDRAIVASREVQIRRGEATDILVTALVEKASGQSDEVQVIIEVKGCWHDELKTAMKAQLVDRYLRRNRCRHGLYLVGWFLCERWSLADHRRRKAPKWSLEKARQTFLEQAIELTEADRTIGAYVLDCRI